MGSLRSLQKGKSISENISISQKEVWIPVEVNEGMFSTEYAVSIQLFDGMTVSLFVHKSLVRKGEDGIQRLKTAFIDKDPNSNRMRVRLHDETFETSSVWIDVAC